MVARLLEMRWLLPVVALTLFAAGFAAGNSWRGTMAAAALAEAKAQTAQCQAAGQKARAESAEVAAAALGDAAMRARAAMDDLAKKEEAARAAAEQFRQELAQIPETHLCGMSAAEHAYRRSVQGGMADPVPQEDFQHD